MNSLRPTTTYSEWIEATPVRMRARAWIRDRVVSALGYGRRLDKTSGWIRFPFYHHVFDDERVGFARHLDYLSRYGDFVSIDDALELLNNRSSVDGRYFCVGFDDGLKSCLTGALPILAERSIPATFYVISQMVGRSFDDEHPVARNVFGFKGRGTSLDFMNWDDCRILRDAGMTIGSHGRTHVRLASLNEQQSRDELSLSRCEIEAELGGECRHFCAPYGQPDLDFDPVRDPKLAQDAGYASFATGRRGANRAGGMVFSLARDQFLARWSTRQLDYFLSHI